MDVADIEFIKNKKENAEGSQDNHDEHGFTVLLNGQKDLEEQLEQFKKACNAYDKHQRKRTKRRYYSLALLAKVDNSTTADELKRLLKNNTKTLLIDVIAHKPHEIENITILIKNVVAELQSEERNSKLTIGLALQITGDTCRIGRIRNNCSMFLARGNTITLTTNIAYRYACFKEIAFIINLQYYLSNIKLKDRIAIGNEVRGTVIKTLKTAVALRLDDGGIVNSYDLLELPNQCFSLSLPVLSSIFTKEVELAENLGMDFIALPYIRCLPFLKALHLKLKSDHRLSLIGSIDFDHITSKKMDLINIMNNLDFLWLTNLFSSDQTLNTTLMQDVIPLAKSLKKPIIGSVPLERCNDFKLYENHEFLWKIDCMYIEKSSWCNKYPLIVKKLLPIKNYRLAVVENTATMHEILSNCKSIVNFIIRTISSIECQAIFLHSKCETAAKALSRVEIYCPVYVMLPFKNILENSDENICLVNLAKYLNLRRNLRPILYTKDMNEYEDSPIDYGIEYAHQCGYLETGDFIITLEVAKEGGDDNVQFGVGEDMVLMRAIYVPPLKFGEKFQCT